MPSLTYPTHGRSTLLAATLGELPVNILRFRCTEGVSQLYRIQIEFRTAERLSVRDLINQSALVGIRSRVSNSDPVRDRLFHGMIDRFTYLGEAAAPERSDGRISRYRAEIVPWLWFLTRQTNCRIFQQKSVIDIISAIFGEYNKSFLNRCNGEYPVREYCVQYRESDFTFVSRLLEEEGIFYYFRHTTEAHELTLSDQIGSYFGCDETAVRFGEHGTASSQDHVQSWEHEYEFRSGAMTHTDFDYENPGTDLFSREPSALKIPGSSDRTLYEYPGGYKTQDEGRRYARLRMESEESLHDVVQGTGVSPCFIPGSKFQLTSHPGRGEAKVDYLLTAVRHEASGDGVGLRSGDNAEYRNQFTCIPATKVARPQRNTTRPFVRGVQTATVTGPEGELVYPDSLGRVKVQFHWDRDGQRDENSSCWVRVSQDWAGQGYGSVYLPHIGHEVIVSFLEGDPDRPLITGRVYNADNMPPEDLPDNKHRAIVAQDRVGNIIALDADEKRVDIQNAEDKFELTVGESVTATAGMDVGITLGCGVGINLGAAASAGLAASFDVGLGFSSSIFLGGAYDASFGGSFSYAKGNFVNAGDSVGQIAFRQDAEFVSHNSVMLAGGSGAQNSVVYCSSENLVVSYGQTDPAFAGSPALALGLGVFGAAVLGTVGVAAAGAAAFLGAKAKEKGEFDDYAKGAVGTGVGSIALSAVAGVLLERFARKWSQVKQPVHGGALPRAGQLVLNSAGARLVGKTEVVLTAGITGSRGAVKVSTDEFVVQAPKATMSGNLEVKGVFQSANILDIGQPAAAAAALAQAAAETARRDAIVAAVAARHAARQAIHAASGL